MEKKPLIAEILVHAPIKEVWDCWTDPQHIIKWNQPSDSWQTTRVENDARTGGKFLFVMRSKDGTDGFDFQGVYDNVVPHKVISYTLTDARTTTNVFTATEAGTNITETFDPTPDVPEKDQLIFCQGVLENFKNYVEASQGPSERKY